MSSDEPLINPCLLVDEGATARTRPPVCCELHQVSQVSLRLSFWGDYGTAHSGVRTVRPLVHTTAQRLRPTSASCPSSSVHARRDWQQSWSGASSHPLTVNDDVVVMFLFFHLFQPLVAPCGQNSCMLLYCSSSSNTHININNSICLGVLLQSCKELDCFVFQNV